MKMTTTKLLALGVGAAALCATALPAAAGQIQEPGITDGLALGASPPPGLYYINLANWGTGQVQAPNALGAPNNADSVAVGVEVPFFVWVPDFKFLGAQYSFTAALPVVDAGINHFTGNAPNLYFRGLYQPGVAPVNLSWNLGNGFFVAIGEAINIPVKSEVTFPASSSPGFVTSAWGFDTHVNVSYIGNDWVLSANNTISFQTKDGAGVQGNDAFGTDITIAHKFGKWELGLVANGSFDLNATPMNTVFAFTPGMGRAIDVGAMIGYNFGPVDLILYATNQVYAEGDTFGGRYDTRVWTTVVIPIWNPTPPPPHPVIAKY
ncbi:MAG: transporter [Beijerinckiaceae bacterium]